MATADVIPPSPPQGAASTADSRKRKSQIDVIEVDLALPEPPSKKAKRLLKKGKPLPVKPESDDEPDEEDELPKSISRTNGKENNKKSQRSDHGVWIGNLPFTMTRVELFKWFIESSGGVIKEENITRVNLPMSKASGKSQDRSTKNEEGNEEKGKKSPENRGFAYVDFDNEASAVAAQALTETELSGRKVLIKNSKSFDGRPLKQDATSTTDGTGASTNGAAKSDKRTSMPSRKIYVGNLSFQTDEDDIWAQFEKCGEIEWVKVATFEDSGKCKGYGWVKFKEPEAAEWAVKGFVRIKEEIATEDDFREPGSNTGRKDEDNAGSADDGEHEINEEERSQPQKEEKKFKTRKWWVNRLKGRELKIEFAEDDQVRYKKRFKQNPSERGRDGKPLPSREGKRSDAGASDSALTMSEAKENPDASSKPIRKGAKSYGDAAVASYLSGAVVQPQGKKTTFE